jgi:uncharacterized protein YjbI with pentapeptide repeats
MVVGCVPPPAQGAMLEGADLEGANLTGAVLREAACARANFRSAQLGKVKRPSTRRQPQQQG